MQCLKSFLKIILKSIFKSYSKIKWLNLKEIDKFDVNSISEYSSDRYILEINLEYC